MDGTKQMAFDVLLLNQSIHSSTFSIACRFYSWEGSWLSIGRNQKDIPPGWENLVKEKKINIVRRPSGGATVLHSGGLTYSLIWKAAPRQRKEAYFQASQWIIKSFAELDLPLQFGHLNANSVSGNCFASSTAADLLDNYGNKRVGSAQYWKGGNVLQHGEILLAPHEELWNDLFKSAPPKQISINLTATEIEEVLKRNLFSSWPNLIWKTRDLTKSEKNQIRVNAKNYLFRSNS